MTNPKPRQPKDPDACTLQGEIKILRRLISRISKAAAKEEDTAKLADLLDLLARSTVRLGRCLEIQSKFAGDGGASEFERAMHQAIAEINADWNEAAKQPPQPTLPGWKPPNLPTS